MSELKENYQQQKIEFLDNLEPDDFRNGESFNQAAIIIDQINKVFYQRTINKENPCEFITKALNNLFRENSSSIKKAIDLAKIYLKSKSP